MTNTRHSPVERPDERGSALVAILLLLMMMSALAAALGVSGQTETLISRNQHSGAQAQAAAEAGLNHAVELATTYIFQWKANNFGSPGAAVDGLLAGPDRDPATVGDNTSLDLRNPGIDEAEAIPLGETLNVAAGFDARYAAIVMDDDATAPDENGDLYNDVNDTLIVRATGYGPDGTIVVLEALISPIPLPGVVTNGDLEINGSVEIDGTAGGVHSNGDLTVSGAGGDLSGDITASGTFDGPDDVPGSGGAADLELPEVHASDYLAHADFILESDGTMTNRATGVTVCTWSKKTPCNNWDFNDATGGWGFSNSAPPDGTYYVEGDATVSSSPTATISIIAEGSIDISGSPTLIPHTPELLFVTDEDLEITGSLDAATDVSVQGQMLVRGQVKLSGSVSLAGQLVVEDVDVGDLVLSNTIGGGVHITYNGTLGSAVFSVTGWRDVRQ